MAPDTPDRHAAPGAHASAEPQTADPDLASRWLGGSVVAASDESFGEKENLLNPAPADFEPGRYGNRGEIVDGWETRRRRGPGHDWAIVRLGTAGRITSVDVDTSFFEGNSPETCSVDACGFEGYPGPDELGGPAAEWVEIVPRSPLETDSHNVFPVSDAGRYTHVRLSTHPDGGVARLRVHGRVVPDPRHFDGLTVDLAGQEHGGEVVLSSDAFYTSGRLLNRPDRARSMGEGWETRRRRGGGRDFVVLRLALAGEIRRLVVDTAHFKYNASEAVAVYGSSDEQMPPVDSPRWQPLLARTPLQPDTQHVFPVARNESIRWVRLDAFPDGGVSRLRLLGRVDAAARRQAGYDWFNALPASQARHCLVDAALPPDLAAALVAERPLSEASLERLRRQGRSAEGHTAEQAHVEALTALLEGP